MGILLKTSGAGRRNLRFWCGKFLLAQVQLQNLKDRIDPPTDRELSRMFKEGEHPFKGKAFKEVRSMYLKMITDKQLQKSLGQWLTSVLVRGNIKFAK